MSQPSSLSLRKLLNSLPNRLCKDTNQMHTILRILNALSICRTSALGGHASACDACGAVSSLITVAVTGIAPNASCKTGFLG